MSQNSKNSVFLIHQIHGLLRNCEDKVFKEYGITPEQYEVLVAIDHLDKPVRITDVAVYLTRSTNSISMIVDRMVHADFLTRVRDEKDRRAVFVGLTSKAADLLKSARPVGQAYIQSVLSQLSQADRENLDRILTSIQEKASSKYLVGKA